MTCHDTFMAGVLQVHALETAAIKPDPANQFISAGVVSGVATVSIGLQNVCRMPAECLWATLTVDILQGQCLGSQPSCCPSWSRR